MSRTTCLIAITLALLLVSAAKQQAGPEQSIDSAHRMSWTAAGKNNNETS